MSATLRVGIMGAGAAGLVHARGFVAAGGFKIDGVCDLIPTRAAAFRKEFSAAGLAREYESLEAMIKDPGLDVISICLPTDLHAEWGVKALRKGKHVVIESPPATDVKRLRAMLRAAEKSGKVLLPAFQRHWGGHEMAARQAVEKGFIGTPYHARAAWHRSTGASGVPQGARSPGEAAGWYTIPGRSGGGAFLDLGLHVLEVAWSLLGDPAPESALAVTHAPIMKLQVEEAGAALIRLAGGKSIELSTAWVLRLPPTQYGVSCRISGDAGTVDVYTPSGATLFRGEGEKLKATTLKGPKVTHHAAMMRELKHLASTPKSAEFDPLHPARRALTLMRVVEAIYKSASTGRSAEIRE